jgi:hypothetical protein
LFSVSSLVQTHPVTISPFPMQPRPINGGAPSEVYRQSILGMVSETAAARLDGWKDSEQGDIAGTQKFSGLKSPVFPALDLKDKEEKSERRSRLRWARNRKDTPTTSDEVGRSSERPTE